jgi:hypothetical protein
MPSFIKNNLFSFIVLVLLLTLIFFQWRNKKLIESNTKSIRQVDTMWMQVKNYTNVVPKVIERIPYQVSDKDTLYTPDSNYAKLVVQYHKLVEELLAKHIISDSFRVDTFGYVHVQDTVSNNQIIGRSYVSHLKLPTIREVIQYPIPPKGIFYWGGSLNMTSDYQMNQVTTGFMYKFKSDVLTGLDFGVNANKQLVFGVHGYWPISNKNK